MTDGATDNERITYRCTYVGHMRAQPSYVRKSVPRMRKQPSMDSRTTFSKLQKSPPQINYCHCYGHCYCHCHRYCYGLCFLFTSVVAIVASCCILFIVVVVLVVAVVNIVVIVINCVYCFVLFVVCSCF